jgi:hypothetical protein
MVRRIASSVITEAVVRGVDRRLSGRAGGNVIREGGYLAALVRLRPRPLASLLPPMSARWPSA